MAEQEKLLQQRFAHVFDPEYNELLEWLSKRAADELERVELEKLQPVLLGRAGIADLNNCFDVLSPELRSDIIRVYGSTGSFPVYDVLSELKEVLFERLNISRGGIDGPDGPGNSPDDFRSFETLQNDLYPVVKDCLIHAIANTTLWRRTLGIPQLGWRNSYPLQNLHSRGAHQLFLTVNMVRIVQSLYDNCPDNLIRRLRSDFSKRNFYNDSMPDESVAKLSVDLAVLVGMLHDVYTPAGGDMMKHVMGMDEEAAADLLLKTEDPRVDELRSVLKERGIEEAHIAFAIDCIQGNSDSLIGEMIHAPSGDRLDQDRLAYTLQDSFSMGLLSHALPQMLLDESSLEGKGRKLDVAIESIVTLLSEPYLYAQGNAWIGGGLPPSLSLLDVSDDYIIDDTLKLVCTSPEKLVQMARIRTELSANFYQGAKLRGQEHELGSLLKELVGNEKAKDILNPDNLLAVNNRGLEAQLRALNYPDLTILLDKIDKTFYDNRYTSKIIEPDEEEGGEWLGISLSMKTGLDSLVESNGMVMSLREYTDGNSDSAACKALKAAEKKYKGKKRVIEKIKEESGATFWAYV